jgi:hypothetical protein
MVTRILGNRIHAKNRDNRDNYDGYNDFHAMFAKHAATPSNNKYTIVFGSDGE